MSDRRPLVTVHVSELIQPRVQKYAVVVNRTPRWIAAWRRRKDNENVMVLPFVTCSVEEAPDYSRMRSNFVMKPFYVGNFLEPKIAIAELVGQIVAQGEQISEMRCVLDESSAAA